MNNGIPNSNGYQGFGAAGAKPKTPVDSEKRVGQLERQLDNYFTTTLDRLERAVRSSREQQA